MYNGRKILAIIPARGGSRGIKDKNIYIVNNKPLIAYTIEAARNSKYIDKVIVSTDSEKIAAISNKYGAETPFLRPSHLSGDTAKTIDAVLHAKNCLEEKGEYFDICVLLQATSPLRDENDVDEAIEYFERVGERSVASIVEVNQNPILMRKCDKEGRMTSIVNKNSTVRRQDFDKYYYVNGAIYINLSDTLSENTSFNDNEYGWELSEEHSLDIDSYLDIEKLEEILNKKAYL